MKAIIFYSSFGFIALFLSLVSLRVNIFCSVSGLVLQTFCANTKEIKMTYKIPLFTKQNPNTNLNNYMMVDSSQWLIITVGQTIQKT